MGDNVEEKRAIPCSGRNGKGGQVGRSVWWKIARR
jgi:hypothetical protein